MKSIQPTDRMNSVRLQCVVNVFNCCHRHLLLSTFVYSLSVSVVCMVHDRDNRMRLSRSSIGYNSKCLTFLLVTLYTIRRHLFVSFGSSLSFALVQQQECVPYFTIELFTYETQRRNQRNTLLQKNHIDFGFRCFFVIQKLLRFYITERILTGIACMMKCLMSLNPSIASVPFSWSQQHKNRIACIIKLQ